MTHLCSYYLATWKTASCCTGALPACAMLPTGMVHSFPSARPLTNVLLQAIILEQDPVRSRTALSTKKLEPTPGDMLRNPKKVFDMAEEMAADFRKRMAEAENSARDVTGSYDQSYAAPAALS